MLLLLLACPGPDSAKIADSGAVDQAPVIHGVTLSPAEPTTDSVLVADVEVTDADSDTIVLHHAWTVDGVAAGGDAPTLDGATWFAKGQVVAVTVTAEGGGSASATVVVGNSAPALTVTVDPDATPALTPLTCSALAADADADALTFTYAWDVDGEAAGSDASVTPDRVGTWTCTVTVDDGVATATASASASVASADIAALDPWVEPSTWIDPPVFAAGDTVTVHYAGSLAGGDAVTLRYGFDGWVSVDGVDQQKETDNHGQSLYWTETPMTEVSPGAWTAEVTTVEGITALDVDFGAADVVDEGGDGEQWHASTEFPYIAPYLSWDDGCEPSECIIVSWMSSTPSFGVVEFGETEALGRYAVGDVRDARHHVALHGLPEGTRVHYRVWDDLGHSSELHTFQTLAAGEDTFTFLVAADMQDNAASTDRWPEVADAIAANEPDARFLLVPGDLASTDRPGHWWRFFEGGRTVFPNVPMLPVPGNHDTREEDEAADYTSFTTWFALPGEERYYTLDYGTVRVLGFDTESDEELLDGGDQYLWAEAVLATPDPGWVFGYQHYGAYTVNVIPPNGELDLQTITALFDGRLDWFFSAHDHLDERYLPLREAGMLAPSGAYGRGDDDGVGFTVVPSAGDHIWDGILTADDDGDGLLSKVAFPVFDAESGVAEGEHGWVQVDVSPTALHLSTWFMGSPELPEDPYVADEAWVSR